MSFIGKQTFSFTKKNAEKGRRIRGNPDIFERNPGIPGVSSKNFFSNEETGGSKI